MRYEEKYEKEYRKFRLERITHFTETLLTCGDYINGVARIQCTDPDCRHEYFRPKMLRVYFRNNRKLVSNILRLINDIILSYYKTSAEKEIQSAAVFAFQSYGDFIRFNPHYHSLILEGGFDDTGNLRVPGAGLK